MLPSEKTRITGAPPGTDRAPSLSASLSASGSAASAPPGAHGPGGSPALSDRAEAVADFFIKAGGDKASGSIWKFQWSYGNNYYCSNKKRGKYSYDYY